MYPTKTFLSVVYGKSAQIFIAEHLEEIVNGEIV